MGEVKQAENGLTSGYKKHKAPLEFKAVQFLFVNMPGLLESMLLALVGFPRPSLVQWPAPECQQQSCIVRKMEARCKTRTFPRRSNKK